MTNLLPLLASTQVGRKETRGSNLGPEVSKFQRATNLEPGAWPWCAAFVDWVIQQWLADKRVVEWLGLKTTTPQEWRPRTALAFGFLKWAQDRPSTVTILPETADPLPGDIVIYDFSHIGFVDRPQNRLSFLAVEGNTNAAGSRDGDGVWHKVRHRSLAKNFLRIHPSTVGYVPTRPMGDTQAHFGDALRRYVCGFKSHQPDPFSLSKNPT